MGGVVSREILPVSGVFLLLSWIVDTHIFELVERVEGDRGITYCGFTVFVQFKVTYKRIVKISTPKVTSSTSKFYFYISSDYSYNRGRVIYSLRWVSRWLHGTCHFLGPVFELNLPTCMHSVKLPLKDLKVRRKRVMVKNKDNTFWSLPFKCKCVYS